MRVRAPIGYRGNAFGGVTLRVYLFIVHIDSSPANIWNVRYGVFRVVLRGLQGDRYFVTFWVWSVFRVVGGWRLSLGRGAAAGDFPVPLARLGDIWIGNWFRNLAVRALFNQCGGVVKRVG